MANKKLLIDREAFLDWYFDYDMCKDFFDSHSILEALKSNGTFKINAQRLLDRCGYLPSGIEAEGQQPILNDNDEIVMDEYDTIIFANAIKQLN
jgi:hypothetical protein